LEAGVAEFINITSNERRYIMQKIAEVEKRLTDIQELLSSKVEVFVPEDSPAEKSAMSGGISSGLDRSYTVNREG
jgi:hypothetical protein